MARRKAKGLMYPAGSVLNFPAVQAAFAAIGESASAQRGVGLSHFARPSGSAFGNAKVAAAMQIMEAKLAQGGGQVDPQFVRPNGSSLQSPKVQQALQGLGQSQQQADTQFIRPTGSALQSPKVQQALRGIQQSEGAVGVGFSDQVRPNGSSLQSPKVQQALQGLGQSQQQADTQFIRPTGSALQSPKVQQALQGLSQGQQQSGAVGASQFNRRDSSSFSNPKTAQALAGLAQLAQKNAQPKIYQDKTGVGVSDKIHPSGSVFDSASVINAAQAITKQGQGAVGQSQFRHSSGSSMDNPTVVQGIQELGKLQGQNAGLGLSNAKRPTGSHINEDVASKIDAVSKLQPQNSSIYFAVNALNGGEISPDMLARIDQPRYQTGCEKLLNMIPIPQGGITKRPGMVNMGKAGNGGSTTTNGKILPFIFSASESRIMEFYATADSAIARLRIWKPDGSFYKTNIEECSDWAYKGSELSDIQIAQSADVVFICHPNHRPGKLMRYADDENGWKFENLNLVPATEAPTNVRAETVGSTTDSDEKKSQVWFDYVVTAVDNVSGEESLASKNVKLQTYPLTDGWGIKVSWAKVEGALEYRVYKKEAGAYGFIAVTQDLYFEDYNFTPDTEDTPPKAKDPFRGSGNYPRVVFLHQQRLGFASTNEQPLTIWMSQAGNYESMAKSTPPEDDDAIEVTLAANQANRIVWCESDRNALAVGTTGGEWILRGTDDAAITPSDLAFQPQTSHGSQMNSRPAVIRAGTNLIYIQRGGRVVREFTYSFSSDRYESGDLGILARHMLRSSSIIHWAWQPEPYGIIWCVQGNGKMVGITYMKEHDVMAWHHHETNGTVKDVTAIPGSDGNTQIWFLVERDGVRYVERLANFFTGGAASGAVHVDGVNKDTFQARCIPTLPETQLQNGKSFLHVRKINAIKCRVINSSPFKVRVGSSKALDVPARGASYTQAHTDWAVPLASGWREDDRVELIFDGADPVTVLGLTTTVEVADMAGNN